MRLTSRLPSLDFFLSYFSSMADLITLECVG
jgi:hypothetical protein